MNSNVKTLVFWLVIVFSAFLLWQVVRADRPNEQKASEISYSLFLTQVENGKVAEVTISKNRVYGTYRDNSSFRVIAPGSQDGMLQTLHQNNVEIWFRDVTTGDWPTWLANVAPLILLAALWFFMLRQMNARPIQRQADRMAQTVDSRPQNK